VAVGIDLVPVRVDEAHARIGERRHLTSELRRRPNIVCVEPGNQVTAGACERVVAASARTLAPRRAVEADAPGRPSGELFHDLDTVVRRAVVDDDDLELLIRLTESALEALRKVARVVVGRDEHADQRGRHAAISSRSSA
jgi:hypothetical protein